MPQFSFDDVHTLPALCRRAARETPERAVGHVQAGGEVVSQTYAGLMEEAHRVTGGLRAAGPAPGTPVLLPVQDNESFLPLFWGAVLGGFVPVPMPAPSGAAAHERLQAILGRLRDPIVVADEGLDLEPIHDDRRLVPAALRGAPPAADLHTPAPDDLAILQFSSGSTGQPKGVRLTHRNVLSNLGAIVEALRLHDGDVFSNWMPLFHDMGLIGYHLVPLSIGIPQYHLAPRNFLRRPLRWLDHLTDASATVTAAPNFGQELLLHHLGQREEAAWDLSSVRLLLNGAEPISVQVMEALMEALAPHGLAADAMLPVYGLAEATLAVTMPALGRRPTVATLDRQAFHEDRRAVPASDDDPDPIRFASEGRAIGDGEVRIVDGDDRPVPAGRVGAVQVRGPSVTEGYVRDAEATAAALTDDGWLRTGDRGFLRDGRLHVTGRLKDVVFVNGQNMHAHDLERAVIEAVSEARTGKVAVCGTSTEAGEQMVLFMAGTPSRATAERFVTAQQALRRRFGLTPDAMIPLASQEFPRTTSGKLQRYKLRDAYADGAFAELARTMADLVAEAEARRRTEAEITPPRTYREKILHRLWCRELGLPAEAIGVHDEFTDLGGESMQAASILGRLETEHRLQIPSAVLAERGTIAELADYLDEHAARVRAAGRTQRTPFSG